MKVVFSREAQLDVLEAAQWYREENPELARRFRTAIRAIAGDIARNPEGFQRIDEYRRRAVVRVFPYLVSFEVRKGAIRVLAVLHASRDPSHLMQRKHG